MEWAALLLWLSPAQVRESSCKANAVADSEGLGDLVEFGGLPHDTFRAGQPVGGNKRSATAVANGLARKLRKTMAHQDPIRCSSAKLAKYGEGG